MRFLFVFCTVLLLSCLPAFGETDQRTITVSGTATLHADPHYGELMGDLKIVRPTVQESYVVITHAISGLADKLQQLGLDRDHFIASVVRQGAEYQWKNNTRSVAGYYASCSITIRVDDIAEIYRVHEKLAEYADLTISTTRYGRNDEPELQIAALKQALENAKSKAAAMADSLNAKLGEPLHIEEASSSPIPLPRYSARMAESAPTDPGEVSTTGSISINGSVSVIFRLQ